MADRNLTTKDILQKEFKPALRGFNTEEVDEFLDLIIRDYESYEKEIASLKNELERAKHSTGLSESGRQAANQRSKSTTVPQSKGTTNYDILRRLSKLEKAVFGGQNAKAENTVDASEENKGDTKDHTIIFENN
ncbi:MULTISPECIES: cell division regulator GpsB [Aerococcus]|uniref:Cell division protein n=2 Tax=Aerococcus viridans TaxID=1377 RepID=A0AAU8U4J7_9LACT|nr:cell division regulator GpsB [Aerococcus viridans]AMC00960.1 cell division protein [Aerococcus viridans]EFG49563.1 DivIVA domain protein [Aerococcus viridans ATCC 11563 = CCUG 4311]MEC1386394.1 cell division regulator GpsB [Aerococcus viridans]SPT61860.1 Guiding PBP1-shuttling protein [Aerococcus viridans]SUU04657.1 Guiding PBP1-shuttling protein [Aerococcus viridans]